MANGATASGQRLNFLSFQMAYKTPDIDRIATEGVLFTDAYAQQSCTAGRSAFITGQSDASPIGEKSRLGQCPSRRVGALVTRLIKARGQCAACFIRYSAMVWYSSGPSVSFASFAPPSASGLEDCLTITISALGSR